MHCMVPWCNGVIMITTKKGKNGDAKVSVDAKWGANSNGLQNYKTTNAQQFYETYYKMLYNYYITDRAALCRQQMLMPWQINI